MLKWKAGSIALFQSDLYETNSLVVETSDYVLVADPCWLPREVEEIRQYVEGIRAERKLLLLFTHSDFDHIISYGAFPEAEVIASRAFADKSMAEQESILEQIREFDDSYYLRRPYVITYPVVDHVMEADGQIMIFGDIRLTGYSSRGHNNDGMFTLIEPLGLFIAGDYLSDVEFPYIEDSIISYEETLHKVEPIIARHPITLMVPGHGETTGSLNELRRRRDAGLNYIMNMRVAVASGVQGNIDQLIAGCAFPRNMTKFHQSNQLLFQNEQTP
ncbi:MBL fold metallo-hydrolase [Paenibacillus sp. 19GGS1-52]|uniref:MBL fold metallo-hydrolase n=1 Tax=Paenibacillus sp. 19GGS1-52 TaxID=2758563 RepID=UPI001EFAED9E|nr:MBL fold metallo-hydrolase [Paenibacillus sp. 19GGS1-52]ULO07335.1 MBL fold metallo-hydrolase [Paenibacillus sp. 19GGS1-52]